MKRRPEDTLLFYAAAAGHDEFIAGKYREAAAHGFDAERLVRSAIALDAAGGLRYRLSSAGVSLGALDDVLKDAMLADLQRSTSLRDLYADVARILSENGFDHIPLKGSDPRLVEGPRGFFSSMEDVDILVRYGDTEAVGALLERNGLHYQGRFSGSHMTFFTDENRPRLIEVHWDLVNRDNPLHAALFRPSLAKIWERRVDMCSGTLLSTPDMVSYLAAHGIKEYFHKPKWLADIAWALEHLCQEIDAREAAGVVDEWGISRALGIAAAAIGELLPMGNAGVAWSLGAQKPSAFGRFIAERLLSCDRMRRYRPHLFLAAADTVNAKAAVARGMALRIFGRGEGTIEPAMRLKGE